MERYFIYKLKFSFKFLPKKLHKPNISYANMKEYNYLRLKIYVLILLISFTIGTTFKKSSPVFQIENQIVYENVFNYAVFGICLTIGFTITLFYDCYILFKSKNYLNR